MCNENLIMDWDWFIFSVSASSIKLSEFRLVVFLERPRGKILQTYFGILRQNIFISTNWGSTIGWGREIPQLTASQLAARLFPFCFPLLSLPLLLGCVSFALSRLSLCPALPWQHTWKDVFSFGGYIVLHLCAFQCHCELLPHVKTEFFYPRAQRPSCCGGRNIHKPVNLPPSPVYSSCHSSPFSKGPINSTFMAHSDGPDFSYFGWHSQISKYFLAECRIWFSFFFNSWFPNCYSSYLTNQHIFFLSFSPFSHQQYCKI